MHNGKYNDVNTKYGENVGHDSGHHDVNHTDFKCGYAGYDAMRNRAISDFSHGDYRRLERGSDRPPSFSALNTTPMRKYKKGGHISHEGKEKKRAHLHHLQQKELKDVRRLIEKEKHLKKGGRCSMGGSFMKQGEPHHPVEGGSLTNLHIPEKKHLKKGHPMKKGGRACHHGGKLEMGYKKGGHLKHHHKHHAMHRAGGGSTVYEHEMVGEHPSHAFHHYNYEGQMRGEYPRHEADHGHSGMVKVYRHGGHHGHHHHHHHNDHHKHHGRHKYAAGGVGKMRHEEATSHGMPIHNKHHRSSQIVKVY